MTAAATGHLKVTMPNVDAAIRPTVNMIDSESLALVTVARCDDEVEVPTGTYILSSTLPTGERSVAFAEVAPDSLVEVELAPLDEPTPATRDGMRKFDASAPLFVRFLCSGRSGVDVVASDAQVTRVPDRGGMELEVRAGRHNGVLFAQFAAPGEVPLSVALPIHAATDSRACRVSVTQHPLTATVTLPDSPLVDAVARYLYSGNLQQAASVAASADELLDHKSSQPFGAVLGGYALLRIGERDRLGEWPWNVARWLPWLPDAAIVAGAAAALAGDHPRAARCFCEAAERGLPTFVDGFSMLLSSLREYDDANAPADVPRDVVAEAARHAQRLLPIGALIDYARISLAVHGLRLEDPANSQEQFHPDRATDDWSRVPTSVGAQVS